jgi:hypothetical protein
MTVGSTADGAHEPVWQALLEEPIRHCGVEGNFWCNAPHQVVLHTVSKPVIAAMMVCRRAASACTAGSERQPSDGNCGGGKTWRTNND